MTMVNLPFLFFLHGAAVSGVYGCIGVVGWTWGRTLGWPRVTRLGRSLVWASGGTFLGYTGILVVWMMLAGVDGVHGLDLGVAAFLYLTALLPLVPPIWALLRYSGDDDTEGEPSGTVSHD